MPATFVSKKFVELVSDGGADGIVQIDNNTGWLPGATVWIRDDNTAGLECTIVEQIGADKIRLRSKTSAAKHGATDMSDYTVAQNASLSMEGQVVPVLAPYTPLGRA